jgi:hypothetical protein
LEERDKKRLERKERELQSLLNAAGVDRPDISACTDSPIKTRLQSKGGARSQSVEVVIYSPVESRGSRSGTKSKAREPQEAGPRKAKVAAPEPIESNHQDLVNDGGGHSGTDPTQHSRIDYAALKKRRKAARAERLRRLVEQPVLSRAARKQSPRFVARNPFSQKGIPGAKNKRMLLKRIREAIKLESQGTPSKPRSETLEGLNKALDELSGTPTENFLNSSLQVQGHKFSVLAGLLPKLVTQLVGPLARPTSEDSSPSIVEERREPGSPRAKTEVARTLLASTTILSLPMPSRSAAMGTQSISTNGSTPQDEEASRSGIQEDEVAKSPSFTLTKECKHYTHVSQVDWDIQKYVQSLPS